MTEYAWDVRRGISVVHTGADDPTEVEVGVNDDHDHVWITATKDVVVWRDTARNVAATLTAGMRVTVVGYEVDASYTPQGGDRKVVRTATEAEEVSVSIRFATATVTKNTPRTRNPEPAPAG